MTKKTRQRRLAQMALASASAMLLAGCLSEGGGESGAGGGGGSDDGTVEIMYGFANEQSDAFKASLQPYFDKEGIDVKFSSTPDFDKLVRSRVAGNNLPDIAIFPQPGITLDIAKSGKLADLKTKLPNYDTATANVVPGIIDAATSEGKVYAAPISISVKSLVWYPKQAFEKAGYKAPKTHAELLALTEQIKADGITPWCVGVESGPGTGWAATDWVEDYVLRIAGPEGYDQWVKHEIPFNDPQIKEALDAIGEIWFTEGNVLGGRKAIASTAVLTAGNPMFETPPKCMLHRQASFLAQPGSFPQDVVDKLDERAGVFQLPPMEAGDPVTIMGGGDLAGLFNQDDPDAQKVLEYLIGPDNPGQPEGGGFISPHKNYDLSKQPNQTMRDISKIAYGADDFRFDGSDSMPGEVGAGSFWREMVAWSGGKSTDDTLSAIEGTWPAS
ncbi:MAG TPA: ABC transporter substrate-binding protein [Nocardioidaceae bacterium]|nr:ABC transporter substrate-binding protein [Nocardioidaceae bacterium]